MAQINRIPRGYLDLLKTETGGKLPSASSETVAPVVDMNAFYEADKLSIEQLQHTPGAFPSSSSVFVPTDETWVLWALGMSWGANALADTMDWLVSLRRLPAAGSVSGSAPIWKPNTPGPVGPGILSRVTDAIFLPRPLTLQSGSEVILDALNGNQLRTGTCTLTIARLRG